MKSKSTNSKSKIRSSKNSTISTEISPLPESIHVIGTTPGGSDVGREVVVSIAALDRDHIFRFPVPELAFGDRKSLATALAETGHIDLVGRPHLNKVALTLLKIAAENIAIVFSTPGWHQVIINEEAFNAYIWGEDAYWLGRNPDANIVVANASPSGKPSCTLDEWKTTVGKKLKGNPYLLVAHAHSLAAAIRRIYRQPRTSLSLVGPSSIGKSTVQQSAQSQIGPIDEVISMSGTKAGLLEYLAARPDCPAFFQDIRQIDSVNNFFDLVFDVADGASRLKIGPKQRKNAASMILSNERTAVDMAAKQKVSLDEGIFARLFEIECCGEYGAFHHLHECDSASDFAFSLSQNSKENHGAVWPSWIQALAENWTEIQGWYERWPPRIKAKIVQEVGDVACHRVNNRILDALVFSAWAGVIASKLGILPITRNEIISSFALVMKQHISRQIAGTTPLGDQVIKKVQGFLDGNIPRFPALEAFHDIQNTGVAGYRWKTKRHGEVFLFLPDVFSGKFQAEFGSVVYEILDKANFLVSTQGRGHQYQVRIPETEERKSFIAIKASIRFDQGDDL